MKRILSVILSLALLASALIIPMSVSAEGELTSQQAAQAVIDAVNGLETNINNVDPIEIAQPVDSPVEVTDENSSAPGSTDCVTVSTPTDPSLGSKTIKLVKNNTVTTTSHGIVKGDLIAVRYKVNMPKLLSMTKNIDSMVIYVKTNRSFKMRVGTHNGYTFGGVFKDNILVEAEEGYQPIVIDFEDDISKTKPQLYNYTEPFNRGIYVSIVSMTDGNGDTIGEGDDITFSSALYVPANTAVRDFKYDLSTDKTVTTRFTADAGVTADMILAAEEIENDGRYDADKFAALQTAIHNAKNLFIKNASDEEVITLFESEAKELYKLEEIFRPHYVTTTDGSKDVDAPSTSSLSDISALNLTDAQKASFGEHAVKVTDNFKNVHFADKTATSKWPAATFGVKTYTDYKNVYMAVYNAGATQSSNFSSYLQYDNRVGIFNDATIKINTYGAFDLYNGYHLYNLYATPVNNYPTDYVLSYIKRFSITTFNRYQMTFSSLGTTTVAPTSGGTEIYIGSVIGEKPIDVSNIGSVTNKATLIKYYAEKIANKGYENTAAVEETIEMLGVTTVEVVKVLDDSIGIKYPENPEYTLETAAIDHNVSFSLTNIPTGATVTVKYGDDVITDDNGDGYYEITVAKGKVLTIIPSCLTTEYTKAEITPRFNEAQANNVALNIVPKLYRTTTTRTERLPKDAGNLDKLSNGDLSGGDVTFGFTFKKNENNEYKNYLNKYTPGQAFDFNQGSYDAYADLIYDLGRPVDINKFQHIAASDSTLGMGVYQLYASDSSANLFSEESLVCNYQNMKTGKYSQEIEFPTQTAQYVAIRCYMSIVESDGTANYIYNCFRIGDIAIYGTKTNAVDYKVTEIQAPTGGSDAPTDVPNKESDLLNSATFESIKAYDDGEFKAAEIWGSETHLPKLNSQTYYANGHADISIKGGVTYYSDGVCKNGYSFDRTNTNGNITFTVPTEDPKVYYDFTYDLGDYYKIDRFGAYLESAADRRIQAYEVYIGNDLASLYTGEPVVEYNNYYNTYGQMITFDKAKVGKYIGFRVLNPGTANDDGSTYVRLDELAAYGDKVTSATDENLKPNGGLSSESVFLWNKDNSSVYTGDDGVTEYTAARLSVKYQSPLGENGLADTSKICLANGKSANIVERNVIAIARTKYNAETGLDITTAGAKHSTATGEALNKCWKTNGQDVYAVYKLNNINLTQKDLGFVVVSRIVYEYNGTYYTAYSPVFGADQEITAQAAYDKLPDPKPTWFN